jgi:hypothetical protein
MTINAWIPAVSGGCRNNGHGLFPMTVSAWTPVTSAGWWPKHKNLREFYFNVQKWRRQRQVATTVVEQPVPVLPFIKPEISCLSKTRFVNI